MGAVSSVTIANRALQRLGATRISSLTQNFPNARSINNAYDTTRRRLLRLYTWAFAKSRASLPMASTQTVFDQLNMFPLPTDFIRLYRDPGYSASVQSRRDWEIEEGNIITTDGAPLNIRYIADITDESKFDPLFVEAFACLLAYECCEEITGSAEKRQLLSADMKEIIRQARFVNSIERNPDQPVEDDWLVAMQSYTAGSDITGQAY